MLQWLLPREVTCHTAPGCSSLRGLAMHRGYLGKSKAPRIDAPVERIAPEVSIPGCSRTSSSTCSRFEIGEPTPNGGGVTQRDGSPHLRQLLRLRTGYRLHVPPHSFQLGAFDGALSEERREVRLSEL